mmetsp:Transcript_54392/g.172807  ORF Transcript_54392/g.172807 Transcript_54392/m.172807 type:complete len:233 (-) Transcript_54392:104-802(-)|eukprot:CAMPEP_0182885064 /NCGR_PEP_ID=MMETSP0034_2-20130328/19383_1 /TAXON_ID=156128 /ORGANISM="Nephroselmis pyriformis, Strain CCMP717" /LENGTH=232 /DNA_ID=CAMNT_0025018311 /DNA_START=164 /DNA_END=862 /DNA_ORIENTATION=+
MGQTYSQPPPDAVVIFRGGACSPYPDFMDPRLAPFISDIEWKECIRVLNATMKSSTWKMYGVQLLTIFVMIGVQFSVMNSDNTTARMASFGLVFIMFFSLIALNMWMASTYYPKKTEEAFQPLASKGVSVTAVYRKNSAYVAFRHPSFPVAFAGAPQPYGAPAAYGGAPAPYGAPQPYGNPPPAYGVPAPGYGQPVASSVPLSAYPASTSGADPNMGYGSGVDGTARPAGGA